MADDPIYGSIDTLKDAPQSLIDRIRHYFLTYKDFPGQKRKIEMGEVYERDMAFKVIEAAVADYKAKFHY
jgi:inorganic pyrophosphatase